MNDIMPRNQRLTETELSNYWGVSKYTLQRWRSCGDGPVFIKIGGKVFYPLDEILRYERERTFKSSFERAYPQTTEVVQ